ncbi:hypothetical protein ACA910_009692 [Epithemia clementina (nom. ined.)]
MRRSSFLANASAAATTTVAKRQRLRDQHRRAIVSLYRTSLRLTRDLEQSLGGSKTTALPSQMLSSPTLTDWPGARDWVENSGFRLRLADLIQFVQTSFRERTITNAADRNRKTGSNNKNKDVVAKAMEGVSRLDQIVQQVKNQQQQQWKTNNGPQQTDYGNSQETNNILSSDYHYPVYVDRQEEEEKAGSGGDTVSAKIKDSMHEADNWASQWIENSGIQWMPPIRDNEGDDDNNKTLPDHDVADMSGQDANDTKEQHGDTPLLSLPFFPLTGAFYEPGSALELFSSLSYVEPSLPGDSDVKLQIFEPRYRRLYHDLLLQHQSPEEQQQQQHQQRNLVVPFAHPYDPARYATVGLLYQVTDVREVADQTRGQVQFVCEHKIHPQPVRITKILNPPMYYSRETYLQVEAYHYYHRGESAGSETTTAATELSSMDQNSFPRVVQELNSMVKVGHGFADKALHAFQVQGVWGFVRLWCSCLQERLLQTELKLATQMKLLEHKAAAKDPDHNHNDTRSTILRVQQLHRQRLLSLKLESALTVPRLLQQVIGEQEPTELQENCQTILMELIQSEKERKDPFPRRR